MARDPHFRYVKSLLNFDSELAGVDPNAGALVAYADLTEKVQVELCAGGFTIVGAPYIGEVAGKKAMVLNGSSAIYFTLGAGLNYAHTIEFELYVASVTVAQGFFAVGENPTSSGPIQLAATSAGAFTWKEQNSTMPNVAAGVIGIGWHTVALVHGGSGAPASLFVDGVRVAYYVLFGLYGYALTIVQFGRASSTDFAANGTALRKLRVYRGIAKYSGPSYEVADPGLPGRLVDIDGTPWFENGVPSISAPSKFGPLAARFNGDSGLIHNGFNFSGDFTIEFWLLVEGSTADWPRLVSQTGAASGSFWLNITPEKNLCLVLRGSVTTVGTRAVGVKVAGDGWNHCAIVRKGNAVAFFLGGELQYAVHVSGDVPATNPFAVGCVADSYSTTSRLFGAVDGLRVTVGKARYDFAVEPNFYSTVFYAHPNGLSYPFSSNIRNKTVTQSNVVAVKMVDPFGELNYVAAFNGTNSYMTIASNADFDIGSGAFTVEFWILRNTATGCRALMFGVNASALGMQMYIGPNGNLRFGEPTSNNPISGIDAPDGTVGIGEWYHIAMVWEATTIYAIYVDGVQVARTTSGKAWGTGSRAFSIGCDPSATSTGYLDGYVTDVRVTKGVARYTANFTPTKIAEATGSFTPPIEAFDAAATAVSGVVTDSSNNPCERRVYAYSHADGRFLGDAVSDPVTGVFEIAVPERAFVVALDTDASGQNAIILDRVDPV